MHSSRMHPEIGRNQYRLGSGGRYLPDETCKPRMRGRTHVRSTEYGWRATVPRACVEPRPAAEGIDHIRGRRSRKDWQGGDTWNCTPVAPSGMPARRRDDAGRNLCVMIHGTKAAEGMK